MSFYAYYKPEVGPCSWTGPFPTIEEAEFFIDLKQRENRQTEGWSIKEHTYEKKRTIPSVVVMTETLDLNEPEIRRFLQANGVNVPSDALVTVERSGLSRLTITIQIARNVEA